MTPNAFPFATSESLFVFPVGAGRSKLRPGPALLRTYLVTRSQPIDYIVTSVSRMHLHGSVGSACAHPQQYGQKQQERHCSFDQGSHFEVHLFSL